jgi:isochorismate synthase EntC
MGVYDKEEFYSVVYIRGVHWQDDQISLPDSCGVIEASRLMNEWREFQLKRGSVKALFGV